MSHGRGGKRATLCKCYNSLHNCNMQCDVCGDRVLTRAGKGEIK
jgi:hypothetical protein